MIWFILGLIIAVIIIVVEFCDGLYSFGEIIGVPMLILLMAFLLSSIAYFVSSLVTSCFAEIEYNVESDTKIIALKDNQNVSGSFYLMGGYINEDLYYYYAVETEFGYKVEKIKAEDVYIKYTDGETHIERYVGKFTNENVNLWAFPMCSDRYIIYCPEGTITHEFNIDLE